MLLSSAPVIAHLLRHGRKARNAEREVLRDFSYERKEDQTKIPRECPPRNVLGSSRMAHPDHYSLAHCKADILPRGIVGFYFFTAWSRWTLFYCVVEMEWQSCLIILEI